MTRGGVYDARLDRVEGSEQGRMRPVVVLSRDAIHNNSTVALVAPFTTFRPHRKLYPSRVLAHTPEGGLSVDSVARGTGTRPLQDSTPSVLGTLSVATMFAIWTDRGRTPIPSPGARVHDHARHRTCCRR